MLRYRTAVVFALIGLSARAAEPARDVEGYALPNGAIARLGSMRLQHEKPPAAAIFSHDGKQIITVGQDRTARVWDADTGKGLGNWPLANANPTMLALSRKGDLPFVASAGGCIDGYELPAGTKRFTRPGP
jgi:WD40 repeat protein